MMIGRARTMEDGVAKFICGREVARFICGAERRRKENREETDKKSDSLVFWHGQVYGKNVLRVYGIPIDGLQERAIRHPCLHHDCRRRMNDNQAATVR
eukprot:scaffold11336_cov96-Skeletonema_dohrnii-CCMP3373.AAC.3